MELTFEKWEDGRWFVVLPDYDGDQEDLERLRGERRQGKAHDRRTADAHFEGERLSYRPPHCGQIQGAVRHSRRKDEKKDIIIQP